MEDLESAKNSDDSLSDMGDSDAEGKAQNKAKKREKLIETGEAKNMTFARDTFLLTEVVESGDGGGINSDSS